MLTIALALSFMTSSMSVPVQVLDAGTNTPIAAQVIAWEDYYWSGFHSGGHTCFRAAGADVLPPRSTVTLPEISLDMSMKVGTSPRHASSLAFARGYCAVEPNSFVGFAHDDAPGGIVSLGGDAKGLKPGSPLTIRTLASKEPAEFRLLYLAQVARQIATTCMELRDRNFAKGMMDSVLIEADSIANTFHERFLAARVHDAAALTTGSYKETVLFKPLHQLSSYSSQRNHEELKLSLEIARTAPFLPPWCESGCAAGPPPRYTMVPPNPYDVNTRDEDGQTPLARATFDVNLPVMRILLSFGADPNVITRPGGFGALDFLLLRAARDVNTAAPDGVELHLMRALDLLLAAQPSIHPAHGDLLAHPEKWSVDGRARAFWMTMSAKLSWAPVREAFTPVCSASKLDVETLKLGTAPGQ